MKRIRCILLTLAIIFSLSACGTSQSQDKSEVISQTSQTENKPEQAGTAPSDENAVQTESEEADMPEQKDLMNITVQIADRSYDAVLYDNAAGRYMADQLPYTVRLNKGPIDYCGTTDLDFEGKGFDSQTGHVKGELLYFDGWFVIFLNEQLPLGNSGPMIPFGKLVDAADADDMLANAASSADVVISAGESSPASEDPQNTGLKMMIGDTEVTVEWESNESADALKELVKNKPLTVQMSMYGGFEQVGSLGQRLPRNDVQTTTQAGDIVLYSGNQIVVFYGSNSWAYTRLGHITDKTAEEMAALLGNGDVTITLSAD